MIKENLAANIKKHRSDKGLSQDALAGKAEIATRYLQEIEAAEKQPSVTTIFKLSKALGVEYTSLLSPAWSQWLKHGDGEE